MPASRLLERVRRFCLALPDTEESSRLGGEPHFYVGGKIFAGCGEEGGVWCVGMKVGLDLQAILITRPGFRIAKYVGKHGWITVEDSALQSEGELERLLQISHDLIAGKAGKAGKAKAKAPTAKAKPVRARTKPAAARPAGRRRG